jgi:IS30 family transposase
MHPGSEAQNENTNSWIRQYYSKAKVLSNITAEDIEWMEYRLNNLPRKCLGFKTPNEAFFNAYSSVALDGRIQDNLYPRSTKYRF